MMNTETITAGKGVELQTLSTSLQPTTKPLSKSILRMPSYLLHIGSPTSAKRRKEDAPRPDNLASTLWPPLTRLTQRSAASSPLSKFLALTDGTDNSNVLEVQNDSSNGTDFIAHDQLVPDQPFSNGAHVKKKTKIDIDFNNILDASLVNNSDVMFVEQKKGERFIEMNSNSIDSKQKNKRNSIFNDKNHRAETTNDSFDEFQPKFGVRRIKYVDEFDHKILSPLNAGRDDGDNILLLEKSNLNTFDPKDLMQKPEFQLKHRLRHHKKRKNKEKKKLRKKELKWSTPLVENIFERSNSLPSSDPMKPLPAFSPLRVWGDIDDRHARYMRFDASKLLVTSSDRSSIHLPEFQEGWSENADVVVEHSVQSSFGGRDLPESQGSVHHTGPSLRPTEAAATGLPSEPMTKLVQDKLGETTVSSFGGLGALRAEKNRGNDELKSVLHAYKNRSDYEAHVTMVQVQSNDGGVPNTKTDVKRNKMNNLQVKVFNGVDKLAARRRFNKLDLVSRDNTKKMIPIQYPDHYGVKNVGISHTEATTGTNYSDTDTTGEVTPIRDNADNDEGTVSILINRDATIQGEVNTSGHPAAALVEGVQRRPLGGGTVLEPPSIAGSIPWSGDDILLLALPLALLVTMLLLAVTACCFRRRKVFRYRRNHFQKLQHDPGNKSIGSDGSNHPQDYPLHHRHVHFQLSQQQESSYICQLPKPSSNQKKGCGGDSSSLSSSPANNSKSKSSSTFITNKSPYYELADTYEKVDLGRSGKRISRDSMKYDDLLQDDPDEEMVFCGSICEAFCLPDLSYQKHRELWFSKHSKLLLHSHQNHLNSYHHSGDGSNDHSSNIVSSTLQQLLQQSTGHKSLLRDETCSNEQQQQQQQRLLLLGSDNEDDEEEGGGGGDEDGQAKSLGPPTGEDPSLRDTARSGDNEVLR